jgi:hypothetical protein
MQKSLVRRVERLEVAKFAADLPHVEVIHLDEHGRLTPSVPTRPDGLPSVPSMFDSSKVKVLFTT